MRVRSWWPGGVGAVVSVPFSAATVLAWVLMPIGTSIIWPEYWAATGLLTCSGIVMALARRFPGRQGVVLEALVFLAAVGLLRDASGGIHSSASVLALIPVLYTALGSRSRRDLGIVITAVLAFFIAPRLVVGGVNYPGSQYRSALLFALVCGTTGFAVQSLVASVQAQAAKAHSRGRMLEEVADTARALLDSPQVRDDLCEAAERISGASVAALYEPFGAALECTAHTRVDVGGRRIQADRRSLVQEVFLSGQPRYIDEDVAAHVGSVELWLGSGSPESILYEPLTHGGEVIGVLLVGWPERVHLDPSRRTVATLIAGQAAGMIARSDVLVSLADEAHTDPLTGLPNRRAWDSALARAFASSSTITLAMLDLDHFKAFNDTFGHPAGDQLLRLTAAAWRDQLRAGDLLARLGGEEFGLLICDLAPDMACEVVDRLRACIPEECTASAGVAARVVGESAESLLARADAALYEAKALGRDRTRVSAA
jgi:diguanylate cyclase (GGDEF)-like protein